MPGMGKKERGHLVAHAGACGRAGVGGGGGGGGGGVRAPPQARCPGGYEVRPKCVFDVYRKGISIFVNSYTCVKCIV